MGHDLCTWPLEHTTFFSPEASLTHRGCMHICLLPGCTCTETNDASTETNHSLQ